MDQAVKERWVAALRSGEYVQGKSVLHRKANMGMNNPEQFCCLGVLCDIARQDGIVERTDGVGNYKYDGRVGVLPRSVWEWADLDEDPRAGMTLLTYANDQGTSFADIADDIEEYL